MHSINQVKVIGNLVMLEQKRKGHSLLGKCIRSYLHVESHLEELKPQQHSLETLISK